MIRFDPESHTYWLGDKKLPGVTSVLDGPISSYANVPRDVLAEAAARGTYIHKCCELLVWDNLDWDSVEPAYKPYVDAFAKFLYESGVVVELPEERVWHRQIFYAGTADLICQLPKRKKFRRAVVDYKTSFRLMPAVGPQLAAYQDAFNSALGKSDQVIDRYALHLRKDGTYQLQQYESPMDSVVFRSCLNLHRFLQEKSA